MTGAAQSAARMDATLARLERWVRERLAEAGYAELEVVDDRHTEAPTAPRVVIWPYRLSPWPRRVEANQEVTLLRVTDRQAGVPEAWRELGRRMTEALDGFGEQGPRGTTPPTVESLPEKLRAWYTSAPPEWILTGQGSARARPPALMWRAAHTLRVQFLLFVEVPPGRPERPLSLLTALAEAAQVDRTLDLELPGPAPEPALLGLIEGLCALLEPAAAEALRQSALALQRPARWPLTLVPFPDLDHEDLGQLCRAIGRPLRAAVSLAVQVPFGAGPALVPAAGAAAISSRPLTR